MKNSWAKQPSGEIPVALNKKILSMVGGEEMDNPKSEKATRRGHNTWAHAERSLLL